MSIIPDTVCSMFGHEMPKWNDYHNIAGMVEDGIGRWHGHLKCKCPRCGEVISSGMVHLNKTAEEINRTKKPAVKQQVQLEHTEETNVEEAVKALSRQGS